MKRSFGCVALALSFVACSGGGDGPGGGAAGAAMGGAGNSGGNATAGAAGNAASGSGQGGSSSGSSAGGAAGTSSGAGGTAVAVARGGISLNIQAPAGCALMAHYEELPLTAMGHAVTATEKGPGIENDGRQSDGSPATVSCRLLGKNAPYTINGGISAGAGKMERQVTFSAPLTQNTASAGTIVVSLANDVNYSGSCMFTAIEVDAAAHKAWASFECASLMPQTGDAACAAGPSYFFFENCE